MLKNFWLDGIAQEESVRARLRLEQRLRNIALSVSGHAFLLADSYIDDAPQWLHPSDFDDGTYVSSTPAALANVQIG